MGSATRACGVVGRGCHGRQLFIHLASIENPFFFRFTSDTPSSREPSLTHPCSSFLHRLRSLLEAPLSSPGPSRSSLSGIGSVSLHPHPCEGPGLSRPPLSSVPSVAQPRAPPGLGAQLNALSQGSAWSLSPSRAHRRTLHLARVPPAPARLSLLCVTYLRPLWGPSHAPLRLHQKWTSVPLGLRISHCPVPHALRVASCVGVSACPGPSPRSRPAVAGLWFERPTRDSQSGCGPGRVALGVWFSWSYHQFWG